MVYVGGEEWVEFWVKWVEGCGLGFFEEVEGLKRFGFAVGKGLVGGGEGLVGKWEESFGGRGAGGGEGGGGAGGGEVWWFLESEIADYEEIGFDFRVDCARLLYFGEVDAMKRRSGQGRLVYVDKFNPDNVLKFTGEFLHGYPVDTIQVFDGSDKFLTQVQLEFETDSFGRNSKVMSKNSEIPVYQETELQNYQIQDTTEIINCCQDLLTKISLGAELAVTMTSDKIPSPFLPERQIFDTDCLVLSDEQGIVYLELLQPHQPFVDQNPKIFDNHPHPLDSPLYSPLISNSFLITTPHAFLLIQDVLLYEGP